MWYNGIKFGTKQKVKSDDTNTTMLDLITQALGNNKTQEANNGQDGNAN